jgi:hypothetical protein
MLAASGIYEYFALQSTVTVKNLLTVTLNFFPV